jgi:hypothetical protein
VPASVRDVMLPPAYGEAASVAWDAPAARGSVRTRWVLDCSGRAGVIARRGLRRRDAAPATTALIGVWRRAGGWPLDDAAATLIESYRDGWCWSVPVTREERHVAAMIDPRHTAVARGADLDRVYRAEIAKTEMLRRLLDDATPLGAPWARSAARYGAAHHAGPGWLLVGDAGSFLDPLSSAGVRKALASAYLAAIAVHTALTKPAMRETARDFFDERERASHARYGTLTAGQYRAGADHHAHPFWAARAAPLAAASPDGRSLTASALDADPRLLHAFEALRADPSPRLRPAPGVRRLARPTIAGRELVLAEHVVVTDAPGGVRWFRGVELPALVDAAAQHDGIGELYEAYNRRTAGVALPAFLGAVSALVALGALEHVGAARPSNPGQS